MRFAATIALLLGLVWAHPAAAVAPPPATGDRALVAADAVLASQVGAEVLAAGGNVVDAAVATVFALGVVHPQSSGIGGGGFLIYWDAAKRQPTVLDFRETAPARAHRDLFMEGDQPRPEWSSAGPLSVAVPGEVKGLYEIHKRRGKLGWKRLVLPAAQLASKGFPVDYELAVTCLQVQRSKGFDAWHELRAEILKKDGRCYAPGEIMKRPALAETLRRIAERGPDGFYKGPVAKAIVAAMGSRGVLTAADLAGYTPAVLEPVRGRYRGFEVLGFPLPSSGGVIIQMALNVLATHDLRALGHNSSAYLHLLAQTLKFGFADRANLLGDVSGLPVARLVGDEHARKLAAAFDPQRTTPHPDWPVPARTLPGDGGTSHLSVIDAEGNAVALTTTINTWFGSKLVAPGTGVILNNEMDDFAIRPGVPNEFGLVQSDANAVGPGKRPLSSMSPTLLLEDGKAVLAVGASGGPRIISATLQALLNAVDFRMDPAEALSAPRVHHQWVPDELAVEEGIAADVIEALQRRGHIVEPEGFFGHAQMAVARAPLPRPRAERSLGLPWRLEAASDPRKGGWPAGR